MLFLFFAYLPTQRRSYVSGSDDRFNMLSHVVVVVAIDIVCWIAGAAPVRLYYIYGRRKAASLMTRAIRSALKFAAYWIQPIIGDKLIL